MPAEITELEASLIAKYWLEVYAGNRIIFELGSIGSQAIHENWYAQDRVNALIDARLITKEQVDAIYAAIYLSDDEWKTIWAQFESSGGSGARLETAA